MSFSSNLRPLPSHCSIVAAPNYLGPRNRACKVASCVATFVPGAPTMHLHCLLTKGVGSLNALKLRDLASAYEMVLPRPLVVVDAALTSSSDRL